MTHEARQIALMRDVLRFVPDEHQREAGDALIKLIADVRTEAEDKRPTRTANITKKEGLANDRP